MRQNMKILVVVTVDIIVCICFSSIPSTRVYIISIALCSDLSLQLGLEIGQVSLSLSLSKHTSSIRSGTSSSVTTTSSLHLIVTRSMEHATTDLDSIHPDPLLGVLVPFGLKLLLTDWASSVGRGASRCGDILLTHTDRLGDSGGSGSRIGSS